MKLLPSLTNSECHPFGMFECFSYHQEDEAIDHTIFSDNLGLGHIINKLFLSNFMGMVSLISVIFDTGATYSYSSNKGDFVEL